jgi:predicted nucleotidyltransferase
MAQKAWLKPLNEFRRRLSLQVKLEELIVFGSQVRGAATIDSDVDVLVVSKDFENMSEEQRYDAVYNAALDIEPEVHPWPITKKELAAASKLTVFGQAREQGIRVGT